MKTKKYSISMKAVFTLVAAFVFTVFVNGQFQTPSPDSPVTQAPSEEVRFGETGVTYSLNNVNHTAGDQYRWVITGGTITAASAGTVTGGNTVEFAADAHTITVDWDQAPAGAISSLAANIQVQKINGAACPSQILTLNVDVWNPATATITTTTESICSGDAPGVATVPVALTGAPDGTVDGFSVSYSFTVPAGLAALDGGGSAVTTTGTLTTDGASVNIPMPAALINSNAGPVDFVVNLTAMNDDFTGPGTISGTYTVTVNPVPVTGDIVSSSSQTRR